VNSTATRRSTSSPRVRSIGHSALPPTIAACARAATGHAAAAPPSSATTSRRLMPGMRSLPGAAAYDSR
jgi:hypothetical protein